MKIKTYRNQLVKCTKCHDNYFMRNTLRQELYPKGYTPQKDLCINCNAVQAIASTIAAGRKLTTKDLSNMPGIIRFDDNNPLEASLAAMFRERTQELISS